MLVLDQPDFPATQTTELMIAQSGKERDAPRPRIGVCLLAENPVRTLPSGAYSAVNGVSPLLAAENYLRSTGLQEVRVSKTLEVNQSPRSGKLKLVPGTTAEYRYLPNTGFYGVDRVTFTIEIGGRKASVEYSVKVVDGVADDYYEDRTYCPNGQYWKIGSISQHHPAGPNPSLKRSANGRPPGPGRRYAVHFRQPGPGVLPLVPA
jgi:hypothetical protein